MSPSGPRQTTQAVHPFVDLAEQNGTAAQIDPLDKALVQPLIDEYKRHHPKSSASRIVQAFEVSAEAHQAQRRKSGEPYITHPVAVALILAGLGMDDVTLSAALLHDSVEDTGITLDYLDARFGPDVAAIVDGVTKLERIQFDSKEAQQAASMRKMLVAMAKDLRVLVIKLADRLHNMRTIGAVDEEWKRRRTAQETLDIYAPLAHRLGIGEIKHELEDLSFLALEPRKYAEIRTMVASRAPQAESFLSNAIERVRDHLLEVGITAEISGREKHYWSIYEKMVIKGKEFDDIHDLTGIRIITDSVKDCYAALGTIHATWKPIQGRFKDYIAMPKFNLYQSLHTTVVGPEGKVVECQIRTREMHRLAEFGIAAHWSYKDDVRTRRGRAGEPGEMAWLQRLVENQPDEGDPTGFLESLKVDLDQDEVFVFTPKGKVVTLPVGATPIDFAYAIHTDVGHRCIGARVNGRLLPLDSKLSSGETIEIITSKANAAQPSRDWLNIVITPRARNKIRVWFSKDRREAALETGREEIAKALRRESLPVQKLSGGPVMKAVAAKLGFPDVDHMLVAIGENQITANQVANAVARELRPPEEEADESPMRQLPGSRTRRRSTSSVGVHAEGLDDLLMRLAGCCHPVPGDEIIGFVTRGRGISVHRSDCSNSNSLRDGQGARVVDVEWDHSVSSGTAKYVVSIMVEALDRARLLADVARVLSDNHVNVLSCSTHTGNDRVAQQRFDFELADPSHLDAILQAVRGVESVYDAYRLVPGQARR